MTRSRRSVPPVWRALAGALAAVVLAVSGCSRDGRATAADVPADHQARLTLALTFLQRARETADPSLYGKADALLTTLDREVPDDPGVLIGRGTLALARHQFRDGLHIGQRAMHVAPGNVAALGIVVDASNELGHYDRALLTTQRMVDDRPGIASLSRVSYARELHGDLPGAVDAMAAAVRAGVGTREPEAYVQTQLGLLLLTSGDLAGADAAFTAATSSFKDFTPALVGQARLLIARGDDGAAARLLARAAQVQPLADTVGLEGDALAAAGDRAGARKAWGLVGAIADLYRANGVAVDLEMALFEADHHPGPAAVAHARAALRARPSIFGHDVLAWSLYRAGRPAAAWAEDRKALTTGSRDPQLRFHAAVIAHATGHDRAARVHLAQVLATNPRFSPLHATTVARLATALHLTAGAPS